MSSNEVFPAKEAQGKEHFFGGMPLLSAKARMERTVESSFKEEVEKAAVVLEPSPKSAAMQF